MMRLNKSHTCELVLTILGNMRQPVFLYSLFINYKVILLWLFICVHSCMEISISTTRYIQINRFLMQQHKSNMNPWGRLHTKPETIWFKMYESEQAFKTCLPMPYLMNAILHQTMQCQSAIPSEQAIFLFVYLSMPYHA